MVAGSSLTPHAALLVHCDPSGTIWTVMDLQGHKNAACKSRPGYLYPCHWRVWIVLKYGFRLCQAIKWISVLVELCWVLANPII